MEKGWIKLRSYTEVIRGEIDKQMLEENGIPAVLINKQDSSFRFGKIDIFVHEKDIEQAKDLVQQDGLAEDEN